MKEFWKNKTVLLTGSTSGLGAALTTQFLALGAQVAGVARHARPSPAPLILADVADARSVHRIHAEALSYLGQIDVLIHCASTLGPVPLRLLLDTDCEDFGRALDTNVLGPFRLTKLVVPEMILRGNGSVIFVSSDAAVSAYPAWGAYSASKAAQDQLARVLAEELRGTGVRVAAWDPGDMATPMHFAAVPGADPAQLHSPAESARLMLEQIAGERWEPVRRALR
jgi:NAD(P)-dependent dehydrogenase (short-subunit alcohol dehydrogenase family)